MTVATGGPPPVTLCRVGVARAMGGVSGGAETECACALLVRETRGLAAAAPPTSPLPPLLVERRVSLWLEIRRLGSPLEVSDIEDIESRGSSSPLQSGMVMTRLIMRQESPDLDEDVFVGDETLSAAHAASPPV